MSNRPAGREASCAEDRPPRCEPYSGRRGGEVDAEAAEDFASLEMLLVILPLVERLAQRRRHRDILENRPLAFDSQHHD